LYTATAQHLGVGGVPAPGLSAADGSMGSMTDPIRVTVWNENFHETSERDGAAMAERYPEGLHGTIAQGLQSQLGERVVTRTATLDQPEHGLTEEVLEQTDVLTWWAHIKHADVDDAVVERVHQRVLGGMGLLVLHSGHFSKIFKRLMGTSCALAWRSADDAELVWTVAPGHPIAEGVPHPIRIPQQEMYGEYFDIPEPDELVFVSSFTGGEVFRSGCTFRRGRGRVFYFSPGDQDFPVYHHPDIQRVLANAVRWAAPEQRSGRVAPGLVNMKVPDLVGAEPNPEAGK
jgi:trehalose utilization protein